MQDDIKLPKKQEPEKTSTEQPSEEENIFIANPEPPKAAKTNTIAWEVIAAIGAVIILIVGAALWSFTAANNAAVKYESAVKEQLVEVDDYLKPLNPKIVLSNSDIEASVKDITSLQQPVLESVIFGSLLSTKYQHAEQVRQEVDGLYEKLHAIARDLTILNDTRPEVRNIMTNIQEAQVEETDQGIVAKPQTVDSLRSLSGTLTSSAQKLDKLKTPTQLDDVKKQVIEQLNEQAKLYSAWATAIEEKKNGEISKIQDALEKSNEKLSELTSDENYIQQFEPTYEKLLERKKALDERLTS